MPNIQSLNYKPDLVVGQGSGIFLSFTSEYVTLIHQ